MKKRIISVLLTATLVVGLTACGGKAGDGTQKGSAASSKSDNTLVIVDDDWEGIDLFQVSSWNDMQSLIADTILGTDPDTKEAIPNIASESKWSDDGLTWTLTFPEGMYYSTGEQVEPEDFIASVEYGRKVSEYADGYSSIESMEVDGRDVIVHLSEFQADMEYNFESCFVGMIDKDIRQITHWLKIKVRVRFRRLRLFIPVKILPLQKVFRTVIMMYFMMFRWSIMMSFVQTVM